MSLFTGRSPAAHGLRENRLPIGAGTDHLFARFAAAGARTALFGKNHAWTPDGLAGFDAVEVYQMHGKDAVRSRTPPTPADEAVARWRREAVPYFESAVAEAQPGGEAADRSVRQTDDTLAIPARLRSQWLGVGLDEMTDDDVRRVQATYLGMIELVDAQVGRVLEAFAASGHLGKTLVVFCSDHGDFQGDRGLVGKSTVLDESLLGVPMVFAGPGVQAGASDALVSLEDISPTVLDLAGLPPLPAADGRSFAAGLRGETETHRGHRRATHAFGRDRGWTAGEIDAANARCHEERVAANPFWFLDALKGRTDSVHEAATGWKLVTHDAPDPPDQLSQLNDDPRELKDPAAAAEHAETLERLRGLLG